MKGKKILVTDPFLYSLGHLKKIVVYILHLLSTLDGHFKMNRPYYKGSLLIFAHDTSNSNNLCCFSWGLILMLLFDQEDTILYKV